MYAHDGTIWGAVLYFMTEWMFAILMIVAEDLQLLLLPWVQIVCGLGSLPLEQCTRIRMHVCVCVCAGGWRCMCACACAQTPEGQLVSTGAVIFMNNCMKTAFLTA